MTKTTLLMPLAASLMLGSAAFAQDQQPASQPMPQMQNGAAQSTDQSSGMDPRQSANGGMAIDQETSINGIQAACTGVGDQQENNARWSAYPVKVVVSGTGHQFFSGETVSITKSDGSQVAQLTCNAPWVLMKLDPGRYHATVDLPGHPTKTVAFNAPSRGQREVNVVYTGAQETSDQTSTPADQHRATSTGFQQPANQNGMNNTPTSSEPANNAPATNPAMSNGVPDNSTNNSDQPTQQPQPH